MEWREFGDKVSLRRQIASITGIGEDILLGSVLGVRQAVDAVSVARKMSWAANRVTTRAEDMAYCLLGIFDVNMPLLYGEGPKAFQRLQEEIMKVSADQSLLAWGLGRKFSRLWGVSTALAESPADFSGCGDIISFGAAKPGDSFSMTQRGLHLNLPVAGSPDGGGWVYCVLNCTIPKQTSAGRDVSRVLAVPLLRPETGADGAAPHVDEYYRLSMRQPTWIDRELLASAPRIEVYLPRVFRHEDAMRPRFHLETDFSSMPQDYFVSGIFPPELSEGERLMARPQECNGAGALLVHFASHRPSLPAFVLVVEFKDYSKSALASLSKQGSNASTSTMMTASSIASLVSSRELDAPSRRTYTYSALKSLVLNVIAEEAGVETFHLSEAQPLEECGVDSLSSLVILARLKQLLHVEIGEEVFYESSTIGDVLKKLRFVTRPSFALAAANGDAAHGGVGNIPRPRVIITKARFSVAEVDSNVSLPELCCRSSFWSSLAFTDLRANINMNPATIEAPFEDKDLSLRLGRWNKLSVEESGWTKVGLR